MQVLQALVLSHLDYCSVVWSSATKRDFGKLAKCGVEIEFITPCICERYWHVECTELSVWTTGATDTHAYPTRHATGGLFTGSKFRTDYRRRTVLHGPLFHVKYLMQSVDWDTYRNKYTLWNSRDCEETQTQAQTHAYTHTINYTHTYTRIFYFMW